MLAQLLPISLSALALWCAWTVIRTAVELHRELAPVRVARAGAPDPRGDAAQR